MGKGYFSIGNAAKQAHMTTATLRHYDHIGLVKPSKVDPYTNYRYYTADDLTRLNTVHALQQMDLPLQEIKKLLEYDDIKKIVDFLIQAEKKADEKIAALQYSKSKIQLARANYERKLPAHENPNGIFIKEIPERIVLLSDTLEVPTLVNLWNYLSHFYEKVTPELAEQFSFEDLAGIYTGNGLSRLFAVCTRYAETDGLKVLPKGKYLCASCSEETRKSTLDELMGKAKNEYGVSPPFTVQLIVVSGILQWNYRIQIPLYDC